MCEQPNRNILGYFHSQVAQLKSGHQKNIVVSSFASSSAVSVDFKTLGEVKWGVRQSETIFMTVKLEPETTNFIDV